MTSFRSVATAAAPRFATLIDVAVAAKCFGVATSYLIVVGDTVPMIMGDGFLGHREPWIVGARAGNEEVFVYARARLSTFVFGDGPSEGLHPDVEASRREARSSEEGLTRARDLAERRG